MEHSANHISFQRASAPIGCYMLSFLATGGVATSGLAGKTSDVTCLMF